MAKIYCDGCEYATPAVIVVKGVALCEAHKIATQHSGDSANLAA